MQALYFDPVGGAAGDMILASLVHLGCPVEYLNDMLSLLDLGEVDGPTIIRLNPVNDQGIGALGLDFSISQDRAVERDFASIKQMIAASALPERVRRRALDIFTLLARAEGHVHGCDPDSVHFHEIGAADSILDITGIAAAVEWFDPDACFCAPLPLGRGTTKTRHGVIPLPAPATAKIIEGMPVRLTGIESELTTPTGAAVLKHLCADATTWAELTIRGSGYGVGTRRIPAWPNLFRTLLCETSPLRQDTLFIAEADVDDMSPEDWEPALDSLYAAGALDVNLTQRLMKRGRPGVGVKAIAAAAELEKVMEALLVHTSSIGARCYPVSRRVLERREYSVNIDGISVTVKESVLPDGTRRSKPEFRDLYTLSKQTGHSMEQVRTMVLKKMEKSR
jgi:uncharacterized protein (TIGR00299 family) protein